MNQTSNLSWSTSQSQDQKINSSRRKKSHSLEQSIEVGQFEFWYQPTYQVSGYQVLHNEVLLRWRDCPGKVYLPDEFMPVLAEMGLLSQLDRYVIDKGIDELVSQPQLHLSINLSRLVFEDSTLIQDLDSWLSETQINPKRLCFELTESTIAQHFITALTFIQNLTALGCLVVIDNFTGRELTLSQCKQLPVDLVKLDNQFLGSIKANPESVALIKRLREISYTMGQVVVKYVEDEQTLELVERMNFDALQGNLLQLPHDTPQFQAWVNPFADQGETDAIKGSEPTEAVSHLGKQSSIEPSQTDIWATAPVCEEKPDAATRPEVPPIAAIAPTASSALSTSNSSSALSKVDDSKSELTPAHPHTPAKKYATPEQKSNSVNRLLWGTAFVGVSIAALGIAVTSVWHRMSHIVVKHGVVNGRLVRLRSPFYGHVREFYARPGVQVKADQILAHIEHIPDEENFYQKPERAEHQSISVLDFDSEPPTYETLLDDTKKYEKLEDQAYDIQQKIVRLQGELQTNQNQLSASEQTVASLSTRLAEIRQKYQQLRTVEISISATEVPQSQADLDKALASAKLARTEYERFRDLRLEGAVSSQRVDQLQVAWETAQAEVQQAREQLKAAQVTYNASQMGLASDNKYSNALAEEADQLEQELEQESMKARTLQAEVANLEQQLTLAENLYNQRQAQMQQEQVNIQRIRQERQQRYEEQLAFHQQQVQQQEQQIQAEQIAQQQLQQQTITPLKTQLKAPFTSVVYRTEREKGELVNKSEAVLSLLDCNSLWVEAVIPAEDASRLDTQKSVQVRLANNSEILKGEIDLIQPVSVISTASQTGSFADIDKQGRRMQVQALSPTIPAELMDESFLKRVTVKIPPHQNGNQPQQLCGLGQVAQITFARQFNPQLTTVFAGVSQFPAMIMNQFSRFNSPPKAPEEIVVHPQDQEQN
ncbi:EAL domain-containing protein [Lyngbya sp. PCC 8106]|uniref:EAL domain-containing protein n=1 Tax=Lyngbya sp. (strain PCC 8106) TaxID=313612 RepID=UPI0000EAB6C8|nr:EAL domain-containing protein [Lyngbya sp. PCC 8106]EAW34478.1 PAS sensor diguanylate cyclase/phosphodiesterase [Lyngbya sp. PCC 8106]